MNSSMACAARSFADTYFQTLGNDTGIVNTTLHIVGSEGPGLLPGFRNITYVFPDGCPRVGIMPMNPPNGTDTVVKVSELGDAGLGGYTLWFSNCDITSVFNVTKTGVYVVKGGLAYVIPERKSGGVCGGPDRIAYETALLPDYCRSDSKLTECSNTAPSSASSDAPSSFKRHITMTLLGVLIVITTSIGL